MENLIIHKAGVEDLNRLEGIIEAMHSTKDATYFLRQFEYQDSGSRQVYIAVYDGEDVGYAILNWTPKYALFRKLAVPEIQDLNVVPAFRRRGIARGVIKHCEDVAREKGYEHMGIGVSVSPDFGPAQRLYTTMGYVPDGNGVTHDRKLTAAGEFRPLDDQLCLMMMKALV